MKKVLFLSSLFVLATACTNDEVGPASKQKSKYISYETSVRTRSETMTINNLNAFSVTAYHAQNGNVMRYIHGMEVKKNNLNIWTPEKKDVWPQSGTMRFYSYAPNSELVKCDYPQPEDSEIPVPYLEYTVPSNSVEQLDVIYSVTERDCADIYSAQPGNENSDVVNINFRHALSQVAICAQNTNPDWKIRISNVQLYNIKHKGIYTFPTQSTLSDKPEVTGTWQLSDEIADFSFIFKEVLLDGETTQPVDLATSKNSLMLMPQVTATWDHVNDKKCTQKGAYFLVTCNIKYVKDGKEIQLWPSIKDDETLLDASDVIAIPAKIEWVEGKRYVYILKFGEGAGFYPPGHTEGGLPISGEPTLKGIKYDVTVEDSFSNIDNQVVL